MIKLRLEDLIKEHNIKPETLAIKLSLSGKARVYEWLTGVCMPSLENIVKLSDYFNCSIEYLIGRTEDNNEQIFKKTPSFAIRLKEIMSVKKVSQYKMTKDKVLNPNHFHHYFVKKINPTLETLVKLADYFNMSIDELLGRV